MELVNFFQILKLDSDKESVISRENGHLEFKQDFNFGSLAEYLKTMAAFSNNKGGVIVFGVTDAPRKAIGMKGDGFEKIDIARVTESLNEYFSPEVLWEIDSIKLNDDRVFGLIFISESSNKPVICKKNSGSILKEGAIYYRYR